MSNSGRSRSAFHMMSELLNRCWMRWWESCLALRGGLNIEVFYIYNMRKTALLQQVLAAHSCDGTVRQGITIAMP
eukprot:1233203-Amphidinium_carterae.1